jgi:hypothetical protein
MANWVGGHAAGEFTSGAIVGHLAILGAAGSTSKLRARFGDRLVRALEEIRDFLANAA